MMQALVFRVCAGARIGQLGVFKAFFIFMDLFWDCLAHVWLPFLIFIPYLLSFL